MFENTLKMMALSLLCAQVATANELQNMADSRTMNVTVDVSGLVVGEISLRYQHEVTPYLLMTVPVDVTAKQLSLIPNDAAQFIRTFGFGLYPDIAATTGVGAMFHYKGWYGEPFVKLGYASIDFPRPVNTEHFFLLVPGIVIGYQEIFDFGMVLNIGVGVEGRFYFPTEVQTNALSPNLVLALGYAF